MIFLCPFIPAACVSDVTLPVLLSVESIIFYFPSKPSCSRYFQCIFLRNFYIRYPLEVCNLHLSFFSCYLSVLQYFYLMPFIIYLINIFSISYSLLLRNVFILFCNVCDTSIFEPDDIIPLVSFTNIHDRFYRIKAIHK